MHRTNCLRSLSVLLLIVVPVSICAAGEKVATQGLSADAANAVKAYMQKSSPALDKCVGTIEKGTTGSTKAFADACREAMDALRKLAGNREVVIKLRGWIIAEDTAWRRMSTTGVRIAAANEIILESLDLVELSNRISRDELKTTTREVKDAVAGAVASMLRETADVNEAAGKLDEAMEQIGAGEEVGARKLLGLFGEVSDQLKDVDKQAGQVERIEHWLRRFGDSIRRRKLGFFKANERLIHQQRRDLARLASVKIDPDGRGAFARVESRIEDEAERNLVKYRKAVQEWQSINKPLVQNAREFSQEFIVPAVADAIKGLPKVIFGVSIPKSIWNLDEALGDAADGYAGWLDRQYERYTGKYYERISDTLSTWEEDLKSLLVDEKEALKGVDSDQAREADDLRETTEGEVEKLQDELDDKQAELKALPTNDDKYKAAREDVADKITELESDVEAQSVVLERLLVRLEKDIASRKTKLGKTYEAKQKELRRAIAEMKKVGGR